MRPRARSLTRRTGPAPVLPASFSARSGAWPSPRPGFFGGDASGSSARPPLRSLSARFDLIDPSLDAPTHELLKSEIHTRSATLGAAKKRAGNLGTQYVSRRSRHEGRLAPRESTWAGPFQEAATYRTCADMGSKNRCHGPETVHWLELVANAWRAGAAGDSERGAEGFGAGGEGDRGGAVVWVAC